MFLLSGGQVSVVAQGLPLKKPRGSILDSQGNYIIADGQAGLLKLNVTTKVVTSIAKAPPYQPRDVAIDAQGNFIVVDWPEVTVGGVVPRPPYIRSPHPAR